MTRPRPRTRTDTDSDLKEPGVRVKASKMGVQAGSLLCWEANLQTFCPAFMMRGSTVRDAICGLRETTKRWRKCAIVMERRRS